MKAYKEALEAKIAEAEERIQRWELISTIPEKLEDVKKTKREAENLVQYFVGIYDGLMTAKFLLERTR